MRMLADDEIQPFLPTPAYVYSQPETYAPAALY